MIRKNDEIELSIESITGEGSGVSHHEGLAVFVVGALPGDRALCRVIKTKKNYAVAKVIEITEPSPDRAPSDCSAFPACGGCVFRTCKREAELEYKRRLVEGNLRHIGGLDVSVPPVLTDGRNARYRNKAEYPIRRDERGSVRIGFYARRSHRVVECGDCLLQPTEFAGIVGAVREFILSCGVSVYDETTGRGLVRHLCIRKAEATGDVMVTLVVNGRRLPRSGEFVRAVTGACERVKSVWLNFNTDDTNVILGGSGELLFGSETITDVLCGNKILLGPLSFYQVNRGCAELLYSEAAKRAGLDGTQTVLDLYCGAGTIGLSMAHAAKSVIGVEIIPEAVENARRNAELNGITNARFLCADAAEASAALEREGVKPDVIVVDPPRKGCSPDLLGTIVRMNPDRIVYVSCDSATLARDIKILGESGYACGEVRPVDMFPGTGHCEVVCKLLRSDMNS